MSGMSWVEKAVARENEIFCVLDSLRRAKVDLILVGGYAVSALTRHRFSVDCDLVVPKTSVRRLRNILSRDGYEKKVEKVGFDEIYGGEFISLSKKVGDFPVTVDLLVGSLVCSATSASWNYSHIKKNSVSATITGKERTVTVMVPEKELLVAFKVHSGRETDLRDIVMLSRGLNLDKVLKHIQRGESTKLQEQIKREVKMLNEVRLIPSLKGVYSRRGNISAEIARTKRLLKRLVTV